MKPKRLFACILAMLMLVSVLAGCSKPSEGTEGETEGQTKPSVSQTEPETQPDETQPEQSKPEETGPETTEPATQPTEPEVTEPITEPTEPEVTEPTTKPTEPEATKPATKPSQPNSGNQGDFAGMDTTVNGWGLGPHTDDENRPIDATRAQDKYGQYDAYFIAPSNGNIYLTFDEGYENGYTSKILDVLKAKNVKAVFFITMPYAKSEPELVQRMIDEGHVVGNHSVSHKSMPTLSVDKMISEVMDLHNYVKDNFGYEMHLFRPPMGEFSQQSLAVLQSLGYKTVNWSFAYYDYDPANQMEYQKALTKVVDAAHSGAIYLLHAVSKTNTDILGEVIDEFRNAGFNLALFS